MIDDVKDFLKKFFGSRLFVLSVVMILMFALVICRLFYLQIINGSEYQDNFIMKIKKTLAVDAARGCIYDSKNNLLAYNELAYSLVISDNGEYVDNDDRNFSLNAEIAEIVRVLRANGETLTNNFKISYDSETNTYSFNVEGTQLKRFLADVFGRASYSDLKYNNEYGFNEATATADQVIYYLKKSNNQFRIIKWLDALKKTNPEISFDEQTLYEIIVVRYAMKENRYSKYKTTTIADNISEKTVAYINEHSDTLIGTDIEEHTIRKYNDSIYFASIIGYTGKISTEEYNKYVENDKSYTTNDVVGKSGLEQYYESYLRGQKGEQDVYVDNLGKISEVISKTDSVAGNNLYISIDSDLQKAVYKLLEQEIASIIYTSIKDNKIPILDVYLALISNNILDVREFAKEDTTELQKELYLLYSEKNEVVLQQILDELHSPEPDAISAMPEEKQDYFTYIFTKLKKEEIIDSSKIDTNDSKYIAWENGRLSPSEYLAYCINKEWVDITLLNLEDKYSDSTEIYNQLCDCIIEEVKDDYEFAKIIYEYLIRNYKISSKSLCLILYEQGVLAQDDETITALKNGSLDTKAFLMDKIDKIEITPAQLALDPCTGSCVITDAKTGEIRALVSYPGYDNNMLANGVDAKYYAALNADKSNPLWNYATQQKTAPGSTFKMLSSVTALAENLISIYDKTECTGKFLLVDNEPACWINPGRHGYLDVSSAITHSCNYFFYNVGYNLSKKDTGVYNDENGIKYLTKYAEMFGLTEKTGLEIAENSSTVATQYPVMAAIGQSNNNLTTVGLSRYVTAIATGNLYNYQLMSKIVDNDGNVIASYDSESKDVSSVITSEEWNAIRTGMRNVVTQEHAKDFEGLQTTLAGKTGTAQQVETRPNHALFVGYAPYEDPQISIAVRIAFGYKSSNAAGVSRNILSYYFGEKTLEEILSLHASGLSSSTTNAVTD